MNKHSTTPRWLHLLLAVALLLAAAGCHADRRPEVQVILDTDISSDVDDVGAVAVLHALASRNEADILAMAVSSGDPWSVPCLQAINRWFGREDIPVARASGSAVSHESLYTKKIAEEFAGKDSGVRQPEDAVHLYRRVLASQPDGSVTIVTVGYLTNLARLLESAADSHSGLDGRELVRRKVRRLVCMGGEFPKGREWNIYQDAASSVAVFRDWPSPVVFCGFEIGNAVMTGSGLRKSERDSPVRRSYELYNSVQNRQSWDQVTVLYAVRWADSTGESPFEMQRGQIRIAEDGANSWDAGGSAGQAYLRLHGPAGDLADEIERLMLTK
jgi:inosine-uridine nucleoside N-ribohydrolase